MLYLKAGNDEANNHGDGKVNIVTIVLLVFMALHA